MIKQFFLLLLFLFSSNLAFTQSIQPKTDTEKGDITLSEKIKHISNFLEKSQKTQLTNKNNNVNINALLELMPISADNINDYIDALVTKKEIASTTQLQTVNQLTNKLTKAKENIITKKWYLSAAIDELAEQKKIIQSTRQLLDNPVNQQKITQKELQNALQFNTMAQQLRADYLATENDYKIQIRQLDDAIDLLSRWNNALTNKQLQNSTDLPNKHSEKVRLSDLQKRYQNEAKTLISELNQKRSTSELSEIEILQESIYQKQTMAWLVKTDIELAKIIKNNVTLPDDASGISVKILEKQLEQTNNSLKKLSVLKKNIEGELANFKKREAITGKNTTLNDEFNQRLKAITFQQLQLTNRPNKLTQLISHQEYKQLITRTSFINSGLDKVSISSIYQSLLQIAYQIKISFTTLVKQLLKNPYEIIALTIFYSFLLYLLSRLTSRYLSLPLRDYMEKIGIGIGIKQIIYTIGKKRYFILSMLFLYILTDIADISYPSDSIIQTLIYAMVGIVIWLEASKLDTTLHILSSRLRRRNVTISLILLATILLYTMAAMSAVSPALTLLYEKFFMLAMISFTWIMRKRLIQLLKQNKQELNKKTYDFYNSLAYALPWFVISVCIINLIGYIKITWVIFTYLAIILLYILVLLSGLIIINHLRKKLKLYCLRRFEHGAFIAQDIISPINLVSKTLWIWGITAILFNAMDWNRSSYVISQILIFFNYPLFSIGKTAVTLLLITFSALAIYLIYRTAKWLKSFSYHWLYTKVSDLGLRNSLSIFTQYLAILFGVLIAMNLLGIDLTSFAVFAGALGVGIGLGLQDIAKNFISGILLLIERPLRNGDWVTIDGSEGRVKSIGMRAVTLETFDKQEVSVPNGNAIGNSFINFTHSNSIVRTILYIGAGYNSDPDLVMKTLEKVLENTEAILKDPEPKVIMWEYADSSINYRVQYFIDTDIHPRFDIKTEVLKAIWYEFQTNNIEIPFPQRDINFRNLLQKEEINKIIEDNS